MAKKPTELELIAVRMPSAMLKRVAKWQNRRGVIKKSDAIRQLVDAGLKAEEQRAAVTPQDAPQAPPAPAWAIKLEELAGRLNTDAAGAVEVLAEYLEAPEEPTPPEGPAKPKKRGGVLRSLF